VSIRDLIRATRDDQESPFVDSNYFRDGSSNGGASCLVVSDQ